MKALKSLTKKTVFIFKANASQVKFTTDPTETTLTTISGGDGTFMQKR